MKPSLNDNARYAYRYLQEKYKLQPHQAAGVVGNLMQESTFMTNARNAGDGRDGSDSIGIGQWNQDRARNFRSFAGENTGNLDTQLDFVMHELNGEKGAGAGSERYAYNRLMNADNVHDATAAMISYERPSGWSRENPTAGHGFDNRLSWAGEVMGLSPDEIAAARPTNAQAMARAENTSSPTQIAQSSTPAKPESNNGILIQAYNKLTGSDVQVPKQILGTDTAKFMKGISGIGDFAKTLADQDAQLNTQIQAAARSGARSNSPVEISLTSSLPEFQRKKKKGSLSGLGGYFI